MTKRKDKQRELLKEDEFLSFLERIARYIQQNTKIVLLYTGAALALLALFFGWMAYLEKKQNQQAHRLYQAEKILATELKDDKADQFFETDAERKEAAIIELDAIIAENSGTIRQQAMIQKIGCLVNLGRQEECEALYRELAEKDHGFRFIGLMGLGELYMAKGEHQQALEQFSRILTLRGLADLDPLVTYKKAECYHESGDLENAKHELDTLIGKFEDEPDAGKKPPILTKATDLRDKIIAKMPAADEAS